MMPDDDFFQTYYDQYIREDEDQLYYGLGYEDWDCEYETNRNDIEFVHKMAKLVNVKITSLADLDHLVQVLETFGLFGSARDVIDWRNAMWDHIDREFKHHATTDA
jgi:hypothetical protein